LQQLRVNGVGTVALAPGQPATVSVLTRPAVDGPTTVIFERFRPALRLAVCARTAHLHRRCHQPSTQRRQATVSCRCIEAEAPSADGLTVTLLAFDALAIATSTSAQRPWQERRLERLLSGASGVLRLTPTLHATATIHDALVADGWEGTVAKRIAGATAAGDAQRVDQADVAGRDRARQGARRCGAASGLPSGGG
jgi:hypothetical protein